MAAHYPDRIGHTRAVAGAEYVRHLHYSQEMFRYKCRSFNEVTGTATMISASGRPTYVSLTELSTWHMMCST